MMLIARAGSRALAAGPQSPPTAMRAQLPRPYAMRATDLLTVKRDNLAPWNELHEQGLVSRWEPASGGKLLFLSHEWLPFDHHHLAAGCLSCLAEVFRSLSPSAAVYRNLLPIQIGSEELTISPDQLLEDLPNLWVTCDYFNLPLYAQDQESLDAGVSQEYQAVCTMPFHISLASYFVVVAPQTSLPYTNATLDYQSWSTSGWCRLQLISHLLNEQEVPILVVRSPSDIGALPVFDALRRLLPVGRGQYPCCTHSHCAPDGSTMLCKKPAIASALTRCFQDQLERLLSEGNLFKYRFYKTLRAQLFDGFASNLLPEDFVQERTIQGFLHAYKLQRDAGRNTGWTPLRYAVAAGNLKVATQLAREAGADLECALQPGHLVVGRQVGSKLVHEAAAGPDGSSSEMLAMLAERRADLLAIDATGSTALHVAAQSGRERAVAFLLNTAPQLVNAADVFRHTPLHKAAMFARRPEVIQQLVTLGRADIAATNCYGQSPLCIAALVDNYAVVDALLQHPEQLARINQPKVAHEPDSVAELLCFEVLYHLGDRSAQSVLGQDVNGTALGNAALSGNTQVCLRLLGAKADGTRRPEGGWTPAELAFNSGHTALARLLNSCSAALGGELSPLPDEYDVTHTGAESVKSARRFIAPRVDDTLARLRRHFAQLPTEKQEKVLSDCAAGGARVTRTVVIGDSASIVTVSLRKGSFASHSLANEAAGKQGEKHGKADTDLEAETTAELSDADKAQLARGFEELLQRIADHYQACA